MPDEDYEGDAEFGLFDISSVGKLLTYLESLILGRLYGFNISVRTEARLASSLSVIGSLHLGSSASMGSSCHLGSAA